ncbi:MAG TPA: hypothetical protein VFQ53_06225 [Kofleriaceae bacterium]|nr:hypothetical protein [Kofleriaceae bacterium]
MMRCPSIEQLAAAVADDTDRHDDSANVASALAVHAAGCARCRRALDDQRSIRSLAGALAPPTRLAPAQRDALAAELLARADAADDLAVPGRRLPAAVGVSVGAAFAAAAVLAWMMSGRRTVLDATVSPLEVPAVASEYRTVPDTLSGTAPDTASGHRTAPDIASGTAPDIASGTAPDIASGTPPDIASGTPPDTASGTALDIASGTASARLTPTDDARFAREMRAGRDLVALGEGELAVDARHTRAVAVTSTGATADDTRVAIASARAKVSARGGVIQNVAVFAGSVEVTRAGKTYVVTAGEVWERPADEPAASTGASPTTASTGAPPTTTGAPPTTASTGAPRTTTGAPPTTATTGAPPMTPAAALAAFRDGWTALRAGQYEAAIAAFDRATDPVIAEEAAFWAANACERAGRLDDAARRYRAFVDRFPGSARAGSARTAIDRSQRRAP